MSLHIRLNSKGGGGGGATSSGPIEGGGLSVAKSTGQNESVTVACPDHLILADLPVAKSLGVVTAASVRSVGRRSRRHLGERVHFCVACDFPIAIYGRLFSRKNQDVRAFIFNMKCPIFKQSPCDHAFCLACARSEPSCYICEERIQKITAIKLSEAIHVCAAPHCLKSFTNKPEFLEHIHGKHANLLSSNAEKGSQNDNNALKQTSADAQKQSLQPEISTARAPPLISAFSPGSNSQSQDREDRNRLQSRDSQPPRPNNWFPPPPAGPPPYMQNTDQFSSDHNKPTNNNNNNNNNPENSFSNFQNMPPHQPMNQPMNYQMPQTSHFPYNNSGAGQQGIAGFPDNMQQQQHQMGMVAPMGVQFQPMQMNQGGMMQGYGNMMNNNQAAGMPYFQGMGMNPGLVNESEQQSGFGSVQPTQNTVLQPPLPRQPPPPMPPPLVQQQQQQLPQIDRGRDFPPGFGWNDQRGKTD